MMLAADEFDYDAVILAGFGEHGKDALQAMLAVPVPAGSAPRRSTP